MKAINNIKQISEKLFIGASVAVGMSAVISAPAMAGSIANPSVTGTNGVDYYLYDVNGNQTIFNDSANLDTILGGNSSNPGGNLELFADSETAFGVAKFASGATTSVSGQVGGQTLTLSSLNAYDWFGPSLNYSYGANTLATNWFTQFYNHAVTNTAKSFVSVNTAFDAFRDAGGFAAASDPNISYAYDDGSDIKIGLAGHYDLKSFYANKLATTGSAEEIDWMKDATGMPAFLLLAYGINDGFQASEVVKYSYGGNTDYLFSFGNIYSNPAATFTGLTAEDDGWSHNGNYEVSISKNSEEVPEPITGLIAAAGLGGAALRRAKKSKKS